MIETFGFGVPATCANLGPGFNVLGIALNLPMQVSVESGTGEGLTITRGGAFDEPSDARHDPIRRGLEAAAAAFEIKLPDNLSIVAEAHIPRASGLGTQTASFVVGLCIAARLAKKPLNRDDLLGLLVELGGDPAHGAAALVGGMTTACQRSVPGEKLAYLVVDQPLHESWRFVLACPEVRIPTADARRILPPTLPHGVARRSTSRLLGLLHALRNGDEDILAPFLFDEIHVPFRRRLIPGIDAAMEAAQEAGAAGVTISGHGPGIVALTTDEGRRDAIAAAMADAFGAAGQVAETLQLELAPDGAMPEASEEES